MDIVLSTVNQWVSTALVPNPPVWFAEDSMVREFVLYLAINIVGGYALYLSFASLSYCFFFILFRNRYNPNYKFDGREIYSEIITACKAVPVIAILTVPLWMIDSRHTYKNFSDYSPLYAVWSVFWFLAFTDFAIYWLHRWLHNPAIYPYIHKKHHSFVYITPFASHAFNPVDAWAQALPYHVYVMLFPFNNWILLGMFLFVNFWTISIHDRVRFVSDRIVLGAQHHEIHHSHFVFNYGQYTTIWDRLGGTYMDPLDNRRNTLKMSELGEVLEDTSSSKSPM